MKKTSIIQKLTEFWEEQSQLGIHVHAAGAGYFIVLAVFPMLVLLLGLLRYTGLSVDALNDFLEGLLPHALMPSAKRMVLNAYRNTSGTVVSLSALVALWSASRGIYGLMQGLNAVYHRQEKRNWLHVRMLSVLYTVLFLAVVLATLLVSVFGKSLLQWLPMSPVLLMLDKLISVRFGVMLVLQTALFSVMFMVLPSGGNRFLPSVPGAVLASVLWMAFSDLYSGYMTRFTGYANIFGSVYAVALSMLWLYICLRILFLCGAWNYRRAAGKNKKI